MSRRICKKILKDGDVQVSDKEREMHMESLFKAWPFIFDGFE